MAAAGGALSLLAYVSTAAVSAVSSISYGASEFPQLHDHKHIANIVLLAVFAIVALFGIKDSAHVAVAIFALHALTMTLLAAGCLYHAAVT